MKSYISFANIKDQFLMKDWSMTLIEDRHLKINQSEKITEFIIKKLNSDDVSIRYIASSMIIQFQIELAKDKLIERILDPDTLNSNGTMSYALSHLNCESKLVELFKILATQSFESKNHAYNMLSDQIFKFTREDLTEIEQIWLKTKMQPKENQIFDDETLNMVQDVYESFSAYLESEA